MTPFSNQFSAVHQAQLQAQLDMFSKLTARVLDSAGQLAALNVRASRASMEQVAGTMKHMLEVRDPRDLFALGTAAQDQWKAVFSYGRELFGMPLLTAAPTANVPTTYSQVMDQASIATADATTITGEIAAAAIDIGAAHAEAALDAAVADDVPPGEPTPMAKALSEIAPKPAGDDHPMAASVAPQAAGGIELPSVAPTDNTAPPPRGSRGPRRK